jgi:hypothetical protein
MPGQTKRKFRAFRVKDLMINVMPGRLGGGGTGYPTDDGWGTIPTPITPVVMTAILSRQVQRLERLTAQVEQIDIQVLDRVAMDIGWAVMGSAFRCTEDSPTCRANVRISPTAIINPNSVLRYEDLGEAREMLELALTKIAEVDDARLAQARKDCDELLPKLDAVKEALQAPRRAKAP